MTWGVFALLDFWEWRLRCGCVVGRFSGEEILYDVVDIVGADLPVSLVIIIWDKPSQSVMLFDFFVQSRPRSTNRFDKKYTHLIRHDQFK